LTVILGGKRMPGAEDGPRPDFAGAAIEAPLRRVLPACGSGQPTWRRRRAPQGFRPQGRDVAAASESDCAPLSPLTAWR
jgi:hypothetical protein